jgi:amino acid adenylation domain-containing protein/thioester reductase-like protein/non-ribosomal peptide synthase protein (TIGR01720 family)
MLKELLVELETRDIRLQIVDGNLRYSAPKGALTKELAARLKQHKDLLLAHLASSAEKERIDRIPRDQALPLSFAQQRLWFLDQVSGESAAFYNVPAMLRLRGRLDEAALSRAFSEIVRRHEILRTRFETREGRGVQVIDDVGITVLERVTLDTVASDGSEIIVNEIRHRAEAEATRPFDLQTGPVVRATLLQVDSEDHVLLLNMHHIVCDGWSMGVFIRELTALYRAFRAGEPSPLPELRIQYADFAVWQRRWLTGEILRKQLDYWREHLSGAPILMLPTDRHRPDQQRGRGANEIVRVAPGLVSRLRVLAQEENASLFMILLAGFSAVVGRHARQDEFLVGSPIANRNRADTESLIGFFVNTLALRVDLSGQPSFREVVRRLRRVTLDAYTHQDLPFERLVDEVRPERNLSQNPLVNVMFALQNSPSDPFALEGLVIEPVEYEISAVRFDLECHLWERNGGLEGGLFYDTDLFERATAVRLAAHFLRFLEEAVARPDTPMAELSLATGEEMTRLAQVDSGAASKKGPVGTILDWFERQVSVRPDAIAVMADNQRVSYRELADRANAVAWSLVGHGVHEGDRVGIWIPRRIEFVVAVLGALKAGAAYVPLDQGYPKARLMTMLGDADVKAVIATDGLSAPNGPWATVIIRSDERRRDAPATTVDRESVAYLMYTSGSTGRPKGVCVPHRAVVRLVIEPNWIQVGPREVVLLQSSTCFDASTFELWFPLLNGGALVIGEEGLPSVESIATAIDRHGVTTICLPTALFHLMAEHGLPALGRLRQLATGGDVMSPLLAKRVRQTHPNLRLINGYGPTESTTFSCCYTVGNVEFLTGAVPIGQPISGTEVYVLDEAQRLVPSGVPGELYVGGDGLAIGYFQQTELTAERFVQHPFVPGERLYRTGDLVRWGNSGNIEFLGRRDFQVKVRGYRVEMGEVELAILACGGVGEAVVVAHGSPHGDKQLVGYVVPATTENISADADHVEHWKALYDNTFEADLVVDLSMNLTGWNSSYTDRPIPATEMSAWVEQTVDCLKSFGGKRVLEIGCGTGLLLGRLAAGCQRYVGTDFSPQVLAHCQRLIADRPDLAHVELVRGTADQLEEFRSGDFDLVILNSVVQYFPSGAYLLRTLEQAMSLLGPNGYLFVGDVRSKPLLRPYHASVQVYRSTDETDRKALLQRVSQRVSQEEELVITPSLFRELAAAHGFDVLLEFQRGVVHNELTRFRYQASLRKRVGKNGSQGVRGTSQSAALDWRDWSNSGLSLPSLRDEISLDPELILIEGVPNARVQAEIQTLSWLAGEQHSEVATVGQWRRIVTSFDPGVEPEELRALGEQAGYVVVIQPDPRRAGALRAAFLRRDVAERRWDLDAPPTWEPGTEDRGLPGLSADLQASMRSLVNDPQHAKAVAHLLPRLREHLARTLPEYMVPGTIVPMTSLPLTANGKVNRAALPAPDLLRDVTVTEFAPPRTPTERTLVKVWSEVLGHGRIGVHDNFFELGGDSILNIQIVARARKAGLVLTPKDLYTHQTVAKVAEVIDNAPKAAPMVVSGTGAGMNGPAPLTPIQRWFMASPGPAPSHFNQAMLLRLPAEIEPRHVQCALDAVCREHEALRFRFHQDAEGTWFQGVGESGSVPLDPISHVPTAQALHEAASRVQSALDLQHGPIFRAALFDLKGEGVRLLLVAHHLVVDAVSWHIILDDVATAIEQSCRGEAVALPASSTPFRLWAQELARHAADPSLVAELPSWLDQSAPGVVAIPRDLEAPQTANTVDSESRIELKIPSALTRTILEDVTRRFGVQVQDVLLAAIVEAVGGWSGGEDVLVALESHGREELFPTFDLTRTVGWFTALYPLRLRRDPRGVEHTLGGVGDRIRSVRDHGIGFGLLRYANPHRGIRAALEAGLAAEVSFNFLGRWHQGIDSSRPIVLAPESHGDLRNREAQRPHLLDVSAYIGEQSVHIHWFYSRAFHREATIADLSVRFQRALQTMADLCGESRPQRMHGLADFSAACATPDDIDEVLRQLRENTNEAGGQVDVEDIYRLSPMQRGLLFHACYDDGSGLYVEQVTCDLGPDVDPKIFELACATTVRRHPILRTSFHWQNIASPVQVVHREVTSPWQYLDLSHLPPEQQMVAFTRFADDDRDRGFVLSRAPLVRFFLVRHDSGFRFGWTLHHLLLDGWSFSLVLGEIVRVYESLLKGVEPRLEASTPFRRYIDYLGTPDPARSDAYFREMLSGFVEATPLPGGRGRTMPDGRGEHRQRDLWLDASVSEKLERLARTQRVTVGVVMQAAWSIILSRCSARTDVVFGLTVSGRPAHLEGVESMVGLLINTLPLRIEVSDAIPIGDWLRDLQRRQLELRDYEHCSLVDIQGSSEVPRGRPLFWSLLAFENFPLDKDLKAGRSTLQLRDVRSHERTNYPLHILAAWKGRLWLRIGYETEWFGESAMDRLVELLERTLSGFAGCDALAPLHSISFATPDESARVVEDWSGRSGLLPCSLTIDQLFAARVKAFPDSIAVRREDTRLSYSDLDHRADGLAQVLIEKGIVAGDRVGIFLSRGLDFVVAVLAVIKARASYVPMSPEYPADRLRFMQQDAGIRVVIANVGLPPSLEDGVLVLHPDAIPATPPAPRVELSSDVDAEAYVMYTSGSTGVPKGVRIPHRAVIRLVHETNYVELGPDEVVLLQSSPSFDASTFELWGALLNGGTLAIAPDGPSDADTIAAAIKHYGVTTACIPTGLLHVVIEHRLAALRPLRQLLTGGDILSPILARRVVELLPNLRFVNGYGPTENTTYSCCYLIPSDLAADVPVPIGRPIANTEVYVLDEKGSPVPIGVPGELCVGGPGLALGYLNRPELTTERFIDSGIARGGRLYRTGDLVRWGSGGLLEFIGRRDAQVKVRGFRVELGEIDATLRQHEAVGDAVVIAREDSGGDKQIVAYVTWRGSVSDEPARSEQDLLRHLRQRLPEFMVPAAIIALDALPLTSNGKVDRRALPSPQITWGGGAPVAPSTSTEDVLLRLWVEVLEVDRARVGVDDDFFAVGGHSLLATQLASRISEELRVKVAIRAIFEHTTVRTLSIHVDRLAREVQQAPIPTVSRKGSLPLSFAQQRLWFLDQLLKGEGGPYNSSAGIRLHGAFDPDALQRAVNALVARHETLRTRFVSETGSPSQVVEPHLDCPITIVDLTRLDEASRTRAVKREALDEAGRPFDLSRGPQLRVRLLRLAAADHVLLWTLHHIVTDGWSMGIFMKELSQLYAAMSEERTASLPPLAIQYADFACWQREWMASGSMQSQLGYWRSQLADLPALQLPTDRARPAVQTFQGATHVFSFDADFTAKLHRLAAGQGASLFMTLLTAFVALMKRYTGQSDIALASPIANRNRRELEAIIGFFVNTLVLRVHVDGDPTFTELLAETRRVTLDAYANQDVPFERIVEELQPDRDLAKNPLVQVVFALQNAPMAPLEFPGLAMSPLESEQNFVRFDLECHIWEIDQGLHGRMLFNTDLFQPATIERLVEHFRSLLSSALEDTSLHLSRVPLLLAEETAIIEAANATTVPRVVSETVLDLFAAQVKSVPTEVALSFGGRLMTYRELDLRSDQVASKLRRDGVAAGALIGICVERSFEQVVGALGVMKAGAAFVPLDPDYPLERLRFMIEDSGAILVATQTSLSTRVAQVASAWMTLDQLGDDGSSIATLGVDTPRPRGEDLAYMIYTSGSTGLPKGVELTHSGLCNLAHSQREVFGLTGGHRVLQFASFSFDAAVWDLVMALCWGGRLCMARSEDQLPGEPLLEVLRAHEITHVILPPSALSVMPDVALPALEVLVVGGEACPVEVARRWAPGRRFFNAYGPTEATVAATISRWDGQDEVRVAIGRPLANTYVRVLDSEGQQSPVGVPGELYIGGAGLACGYHRRPELTAERFVADPYLLNGRLFRTGDVVRWRTDGQLEFLGRNDDQVKVRGYRIELGEVEHALRSHPEVRDAVVVAQGGHKLVGYIVASPASDADPGLAQAHVEQWQQLYDETYRQSPSDEDPMWRLVGWNSSYTSRPMPREEMEEWVEQAVDRIKELRPQRVLEIGCGTGLLLSRLAPECARYVGTDFSARAVEEVKAYCATLPNSRQIDVWQREADDFSGIQPASFDLVVLNSVTQYLPDRAYLQRVLTGALGALMPGGHLFVGDVRSLPLLDAYHASVQLARAPKERTREALARRVRDSVTHEEELLLAPDLFVDLARKSGCEVVIEIQRGKHHNELTRFRYQAILRRSEAQPSAKISWLEWSHHECGHGWNLDLVERTLLDNRPAVLALRGVPNARLSEEMATLDWLRGEAGVEIHEVGRWRAHLSGLPQGVDPEELWSIGDRHDYRVVIRVDSSDPASMEVAFLSQGSLEARWSLEPAVGPSAKGIRDANEPLRAVAGIHLIPRLREHLSKMLPEHMIPSVLVPMPELPLTHAGKVDRSALPDPEARRHESAYVAPRTPTEQRIAAIWCELLAVERVSLHDDFFSIGGHSLLATQVVARLQDAFELHVPVRTLFARPTVMGCARVIDLARTIGIEDALAEETLDLVAEADLPASIQPRSEVLEGEDSPRAILLTGATGFLGAYLLRDLISRTRAIVYCLVRCRDAEDGMRRLLENAARYELPTSQLADRVVVVCGDLGARRLGLDDETYDRVANAVEMILHNGAQLNSVLPYVALRASNVAGTEELIRLACTAASKTLHYVSTLGIFGDASHLGQIITEEEPVTFTDRLSSGYVETKWVAERMVLNAKARGLVTTIHRPGAIVGDSVTGAWNTDDFMCQFIRGCIDIGIYPDLAHSPLLMTPVDYVSKAIVENILRPECRNRAFHLTGTGPSADELFGWLGELGHPVERVGYNNWLQAVARRIAVDPGHSLAPLLPVFSPWAVNGPAAAVIPERFDVKMPQYNCSVTEAALARVGLVRPDVGFDLVARYVRWFWRAGFLSPAQHLDPTSFGGRAGGPIASVED